METPLTLNNVFSRARAAVRGFRFHWWFIPLFACSAITFFCTRCVYEAYYGVSHEIASVELGEGYKLRIWEHTDGLSEPGFDPDHAPSVYYEISQLNQIIVRKTFLTVNLYGNPFDIRVQFAEDGKLVAVYDTEKWNRGLFFLFDVTNPEILQYIRSASNAVQPAWRDRYHALLAANPDMPNYFD